MYLGSEATGNKDTEDTPVDESADPTETKQSESKRISSKAEADQIVAIAQGAPHQVVEFTGKQTAKSPPPALTTSALQQAAGVAFGMSSDDVMAIAQQLFEGMKLPDGSVHGAITYHRTDSVDLAPEFVESVMGWLKQHDPKLVPNKAVQHKDKAGSQGAHEAIRPVDVANTPKRMKDYLSEPQLKIYTLIWQRAIASQCAPAQFQKSRVVIQAGTTFWEARGSILTEPGYTTIYNNLGKDAVLPALKQGQPLSLKRVWSEAKQTQPPGRYSEPQLIQTLERLGIGRPSTYATIMSTIKTRGYASVEKKALVPTELGMGLDAFLIKITPFIVDVKFTAGMEKALDAIAQGKQEWKGYLCGFNQFFLGELGKSDAILSQFRKRSEVKCPTCSKPLAVMPYRNKPKGSSKDHYLKCLEGCTDVVLFWNETAKGWRVKGEKKETPPGKLTEFVCQVCGKPLEEFSYLKEGQPKTMLRCSDATARQKPNHKNEVYFVSAKGGYWNPTSKAEPAKSRVEKASRKGK